MNSFPILITFTTVYYRFSFTTQEPTVHSKKIVISSVNVSNKLIATWSDSLRKNTPIWKRTKIYTGGRGNKKKFIAIFNDKLHDFII